MQLFTAARPPLRDPRHHPSQTRTKSSNDLLRFYTIHKPALTKTTLALRTLVAQQVTTRRRPVRGLPRRRYLESAFHSFVSLLLWHSNSPRSEIALKPSSTTSTQPSINERQYKSGCDPECLRLVIEPQLSPDELLYIFPVKRGAEYNGR